MNDVVLRMELEDSKNTTATDLVHCILRLDELQLTKCAKDIFALWMSSSLLGKVSNPDIIPEIYENQQSSSIVEIY